MQIRSNLVHQYNTSQEDQRKWGLPMWKLLWKIITGWCKSFVQPLICFNSVVLAITGKRVCECPTSWQNVFLHWLLKRGDAVYIYFVHNIYGNTTPLPPLVSKVRRSMFNCSIAFCRDECTASNWDNPSHQLDLPPNPVAVANKGLYIEIPSRNVG